MHPIKERYFCSKSCANSTGGKAKAAKYHLYELAQYQTVCFRHHPKECVVCEEQNVVAVHHYNENHDDNRPENLVPLCPTHHIYMHSKHKYLIEDQVAEYVNNFTVVAQLGVQFLCTEKVGGSSPLGSTKLKFKLYDEAAKIIQECCSSRQSSIEC